MTKKRNIGDELSKALEDAIKYMNGEEVPVVVHHVHVSEQKNDSDKNK